MMAHCGASPPHQSSINEPAVEPSMLPHPLTLTLTPPSSSGTINITTTEHYSEPNSSMPHAVYDTCLLGGSATSHES